MAGQRLLVVDDEPAFGRLIANVARDLDFDVVETTGAQAFQEAYQHFYPTTIVMDMVMPNTDGIELIHWLAAQQCTASIIIVSGSNPAYAAMAADLGTANGLRPIQTLSKPVPLDALRAALTSAAMA